MAKYVNQQILYDWLELYGEDWAEQFYTEGTGVIGIKLFTDVPAPPYRMWEYVVSQNNFDTENITPYVWCLLDAHDTNFTNTFDIMADDRDTPGAYAFYEGILPSYRLELYSAIKEDSQYYQEQWRPVSFVQSVHKSHEIQGVAAYTGDPILSFIGMPVFATMAEGEVWVQRLGEYINDPTAENLQICKNYLYAHALNPRSDDPNESDPTDGESQEGGGDGGHDQTQTPIPIPGMPPIGGTDAGFVTCYRMTLAEMHTFAADLFDPDAWAAIKAFFSDPMDFICGVMILPFQPPSSVRAYPKFGLFTWHNAYDVVSSQFVEIDCGSILIPKYYGSCFDYAPYTKITIWLPYIGYRELNTDEVMGKTIKVKYHCDVLTGDCIAFITRPYENTSLDQVIAQFSGNCAVRVPFGRLSFDAAVSASIQLIGGAVGLAAGGIAGAAGLTESAGGISAAQISSQVSATTVGAVNSMKTTAERSGNAGASAGFMSIQKPYLIREIPRQSLPENYKSFAGYPSNLGGNVGSFSGFTAIETIKLRVSATDQEKAEIIELLRGGVFV